MFSTPILFLVFNRPDTTQKVFEKIRSVQPRQLFIAADGPRTNNEGEKEKTEAVRKLILNAIDWDCEVKTLFRDNNLGCGKAVSEGITWFFEHVEQGIILEDDTLPDLSFFPFCAELLERYKTQDKIMHISGASFLDQKRKKINGSYYFSNYVYIWGWATWHHAWKRYSFDIDRFSSQEVLMPFKNKKERNYWRNILEQLSKKQIDTWDYQWAMSIWCNDGIAINSCYNLVQNIGFYSEATHTKTQHNNIRHLRLENISDLTLSHPKEIKVNSGYDQYIFRNFYLREEKTIIAKLLKKITNKAVIK